MNVEPVGCFKCGDSSTPLYCLNCAREEMEQVLKWASENVDRIDCFKIKVEVELWERPDGTVPTFTAPTLYEALVKAKEGSK